MIIGMIIRALGRGWIIIKQTRRADLLSCLWSTCHGLSQTVMDSWRHCLVYEHHSVPISLKFRHICIQALTNESSCSILTNCTKDKLEMSKYLSYT